MAQVPRPLSPHLQVYRPQITSILSILHRLTGVALAGGAFLLVWWLVGAAWSAEYYAHIKGLAGSWLGRLVLLGFVFSFFYHLCNGVRHLWWDMGRGFAVEDVEKSGKLMVAASVALTLIAFWAAY